MPPKSKTFISIHDLTPSIRFLWASPSVYDVLGYTPDEIVCMNAADMIYPEDVTNSSDALSENIKNDLVASQLVNKLRRKDGTPAHLLHVFSTCYDVLVNCSTLLDEEDDEYQQLRAHSTAMTSIVGSKEEGEPRVCLILNRYTRNLIVMYASAACEEIFNIDPDDFTGKPLLLFLRADDLAPFVEQMDIVKGTTAIVNMRFWFQSPTLSRGIPCEAIFIGADDGILVVVRRCKPFIRKYFIKDREQNEAAWDSPWSPGMVQSDSPSLGTSMSWESTPPSLDEYGFSSRSSRHYISRPGLDRVKILELDDDETDRPIMGIPEDDPNLVKDRAIASMIPAFKEIIIQDYADDDDDDERDETALRNMVANERYSRPVNLGRGV
ncbi:hypothetical protein BGZ79_009744 [Entomortierella chlamydospora]|nr:hypothetical protein BGZ79_009744 [Entomortierella chlamydospora]